MSHFISCCVLPSWWSYSCLTNWKQKSVNQDLKKHDHKINSNQITILVLWSVSRYPYYLYFCFRVFYLSLMIYFLTHKHTHIYTFLPCFSFFLFPRHFFLLKYNNNNNNSTKYNTTTGKPTTGAAAAAAPAAASGDGKRKRWSHTSRGMSVPFPVGRIRRRMGR